MSVESLAVVLLIIVMIGLGPWYPYSRAWGYRPFSGVLLLLVILVILFFVTGTPRPRL